MEDLQSKMFVVVFLTFKKCINTALYPFHLIMHGNVHIKSFLICIICLAKIVCFLAYFLNWIAIIGISMRMSSRHVLCVRTQYSQVMGRMSKFVWGAFNIWTFVWLNFASISEIVSVYKV